MRAVCILALGAGLLAGATLPSRAQTEAPPDAAVADPDCVVVPDGEGGAAVPESSDDTLSETLAPCDGVLEPAPVGDGDMTITPPPVGETPVIHPDQVPPQPAEGE